MAPEKPGKLILKSGGVVVRTVEIDVDPFIIGRALETNLELADSLASRRHAKIIKADGRLLLVDLTSSNGTYINEQKISEHYLNDGDVLRIGDTVMDFVAPVGAKKDATTNVTISIPKDDLFLLEDSDSTNMIKKVADLRPEFSATLAELGNSDVIRIMGQTSTASTEEEQKDRKNYWILYKLAEGFNSASSIEEVLEDGVTSIINFLKAERGALMMLDDDTGRLYQKVGKIQDGKKGSGSKDITISSTIAKRVVEEKVSILTNDASSDPGLMSHSIAQFSIRSALCVPLWDPQEDKVYGLIYIDAKGVNSFSEDDREFLTAVANQMAVAIRNQELNEKVRREMRIRENLARYNSPAVVDMIINQQHAVGLEVQEREVSVLFIDIQGFSRISEKLPPPEIAKMLNGYFDVVTDAVFQLDGSVNKFIGDAVMAIFGAPLPQKSHAQLAVQSAILMVEKVKSYVASLPEDRQFNIRVGINSGNSVAGNIGSKDRIEYTVIGDAVNTASRLESLAPPNGICIGEETARLVEGFCELESMGRISPRGMGKEIEIFQVKVPETRQKSDLAVTVHDE